MTYAYCCGSCEAAFDAQSSVAGRDETLCPTCCEIAHRQFTLTTNISIPALFGRDRNWHMAPGPRGPDSEVSSNSTVHAPKRMSFREKFDAAYKGG